MDPIIKEKKGVLAFTRISRWNNLEYTLVSSRSTMAEYADNYGSGDKKLNLTIFKFRNHTYPLNRFAKLVDPITLEDGSVITRRYTTNKDYYAEISEDKTQIRLYRRFLDEN